MTAEFESFVANLRCQLERHWTWNRDWKEAYVDQMGLIVALSGKDRFVQMEFLKERMRELPESQQVELKECLRQRFTPSGSHTGCKSATEAVELCAT